ncbi:MAG: peptide ABC transporter substrate-binding protein, partial [Gammaproteobacteria bacterium]|nr:peptide ABC transporter substrate-binding protein [Gammaproteobacteria bacterium]
MWWLTPLLFVWLIGGCSDSGWNNPYPRSDLARNILYSSFSERPKHLDPVRSYSANEYEFIAQIYEPLLQYHFLKRPYELVPLSAERVPVARYYDTKGNPLPEQADSGEIAISEYEISIKQGMLYQPHPALARDNSGNYRYHQLGQQQIDSSNTLADFPLTGTREVTAEDFIYQIKRLAFPKLSSPIAGIMADYIIGFKQFGEQLDALYERMQQQGTNNKYIDLRPYAIEGVQLLDRYRFRIRLKGKYPQFVYWLAMPF